MASGTADALVYMNTMIEIGIVGEIVDPNPFNWLAGAKAGTNRLQVRAIGPYLLVAVHAGLCRGHACRRRSFYRCMAVAAVDAVVSSMVFVAELNRLLTLDPLACIPGGAVQLGSCPERRQ